MKRFIEGESRSQSTLFPELLDDYVGEDNPVRVIDVFVDNPSRFKRSRTVAAHFGLTPRRFQSGEVDNPEHISKAGDTDVRCALYVAAHSLVIRSSEWSSLKVWGLRLMKTKGHRRAVIAVARKLAVILHKMWVDGSDFRYGSKETAI